MKRAAAGASPQAKPSKRKTPAGGGKRKMVQDNPNAKLLPFRLQSLLDGDSKHMSPTRVAFAIYNTDTLVALKAHLVYNEVVAVDESIAGSIAEAIDESKKLEYEDFVYRQLGHSGIFQHCINFIEHITTVFLSNKEMVAVFNGSDDAMWTNFLHPLLVYTNSAEEEINVPLRVIKGVSILVTKTYNPISNLYKELLVRNREQPEDWLKSITFQIVYTYAKLVEFGFQHNDGHVGNILMTTFPSDVQSIDYGDAYRIPAQYGRILLFDWDLAFVQGAPNPYLVDERNMCEPYGVCNSLNACFDIYLTLKSLYNALLPKKHRYPNWIKFFKDHCNLFPPAPYMLKMIKLKSKTHLCFAPGEPDLSEPDEDLQRKCKPFMPSPVCFTPEQMLQSDYFDEYRVDKAVQQAGPSWWSTASQLFLDAYGGVN